MDQLSGIGVFVKAAEAGSLTSSRWNTRSSGDGPPVSARAWPGFGASQGARVASSAEKSAIGDDAAPGGAPSTTWSAELPLSGHKLSQPEQLPCDLAP